MKTCAEVLASSRRCSSAAMCSVISASLRETSCSTCCSRSSDSFLARSTISAAIVCAPSSARRIDSSTLRYSSILAISTFILLLSVMFSL